MKSRYAGYYTDALKGKLTGTVNFGENLLELQHDIIRPPVGIGKTSCLIILLIHLQFSRYRSERSQYQYQVILTRLFLGNLIEYFLPSSKKRAYYNSQFCIFHKDQTILCPAWRNTSKTNLLAVANGARYLADDWVICNKQGHLEIFPKSINIEPFFKNLKVLDLNIPR